jgi:acyl dehydratase
MPIDQSLIGRTYPPSPPYLIGREKVREFATAVGSVDPLHHDVEAAKAAGYPDVVAPPTFPIIFTMAALWTIMFDPDLAIDYSRVVHGDQRFVYERPVVAGDELIVITHIDDVIFRSGNDFLNTRQEVKTTGGELVATVWHKTVVRGEQV